MQAKLYINLNEIYKDKTKTIQAILEPSHEIMVLFVLCKLITQMRMHSHPLGQDVWFLVGLFLCVSTSCLRKAKALARLRRCTGSSEPSLVAYVISTIISWAGSSDVLVLPKMIEKRNKYMKTNAMFALTPILKYKCYLDWIYFIQLKSLFLFELYRYIIHTDMNFLASSLLTLLCIPL